MKKNIAAVVGEYTKQDGSQGAEFIDIGVIMTSQNGAEYALIDPAVNLAGVLLKQNELALKKGQQTRSMVMCSVKERQQQQGSYQQPQQNYQQQPQRTAQQRPAPQAQAPMQRHQQYSNSAPTRSQTAESYADFNDD